jgi:pyruvate,orthophosphate dikinase
MFFDAERILAVRQMILADDLEGTQSGDREAAADAARRFPGIFRIMTGLPVTIRLPRSALARIHSAFR